MILKDGDRKILLTTANFSLNNWRLVAAQPYQDAIVNIQYDLYIEFPVSADFLLCLSPAAANANENVHQTAHSFGKVAASVQRGNLEVRSGVRGADEIGRLGFRFDQMLDRIKDMLAEVSRTQARKRKAELASFKPDESAIFV